MRHLVAIAAVLTACAPPPAIGDGLEPNITIAFPQIDNAEQIPLSCQPNPAFVCGTSDATAIPPYAEQLQITLVVDIDNLTLRDPYTGDVELVDGEGHWHVDVNESQVATVFSRVAEITAPVPLGIVVVETTLRDNLHDALGPSDTIEFEVTAGGVDCSALPEDYCPS